jgi:hypothetical protein
MSQNVTLFTTISPAQSLALGVLVSGGSVTKAAKEAGVARETVSRWVHHDPVFIAEMQNARAELASQTRCALEALGMQAVGVLADAVGNQFVKPWRLRAACAVLKMIGADRAETMPMTTAEEIQLALQEREAELQAPEQAEDKRGRSRWVHRGRGRLRSRRRRAGADRESERSIVWKRGGYGTRPRVD